MQGDPKKISDLFISVFKNDVLNPTEHTISNLIAILSSLTIQMHQHDSSQC